MKNPHVAAYEYTLGLEYLSGRNRGTHHVYHWPREMNGSAYDRTVIIEEYPDGTAKLYLDVSEPGGLKAELIQLRKMANTG